MLGRVRNRLAKHNRRPAPPDVVESVFPLLDSSLDFDLSPYTGWTRNHWVELASLILSGTIDFFTPSGTGLHIPGQSTSRDPRLDGIEGFARSLTIAAPWFDQQRGTTVERHGRQVDILAIYQRGLINGTNPNHNNYWGEFLDYDQRILEAADIAWCIFVAPQFLWDPFSSSEKKMIAQWLGKATGKNVKLNNWVLAKVMINVVLRAVGYPHDEQEIRQGLALVDEFYLGDGWYQDGLTESFDYYGAWMFHDYLLKFSWIEGALTPTEKSCHLHRSERFLTDYQHLFAADGSHVCFGRSQTYRAAALGPVVMSALIGCKAMSPGSCRRLASGNLKFFLTHGMLAKRGNLTLGFTGSFPPMLESYSCGGSPYLIGRAFSALLMPEGHPFWLDQEEPLPVEQGDFALAIPNAGLLLDGEKNGGQVQLINHKSGDIVDGRQKKYGNFAYSSHFGYEATLRQKRFNIDSSLQISSDGKTYFGRQKPIHIQTQPGFGASFFLPFADDRTTVYTNTIIVDHFQIRVHSVVSNLPFCINEGGYALGFGEDKLSLQSGPDWEYAGVDTRGTFIRHLAGYQATTAARGFQGSSRGNNILFPCSVTPAVNLPLGRHRHILLASLVRGCLNGESPQDMAEFVQTVESGLNWLLLKLNNGDTVFTQVGLVSDRVVQVNGVDFHGRTSFARVSAGGETVAHYQIKG